MTGTEKQLVSEQAVADLWGQAPALLAWAEENADTSGAHDALEDHWTAAELAEDEMPAGCTPVARPTAGCRRHDGRRVARDYQADAGWKPLSGKQKWRLAELARAAAKATGAPVGGRAHAEWRHAEARRVCGLRISEASQRDFVPLRAHFLNLAGEPGEAFGALMKEGGNARRVALWNLHKMLAERGLPPAYAEAICARQYKCALADASAPQLWRLVFTVKNRRGKTA